MSSRTSTVVHVALGSNLGDRALTLDAAVREIAAVRAIDGSVGFAVERVSPWIETQAEGGPIGQPAFLNGALAARCFLAPRECLARLLALETRFGRVRSLAERNAPRTLDLDLLLFGTLRSDEPGLILPHPRLEERLFVLEPLAAIAPDLVLSSSGRTVSQALAALLARRAGSAESAGA